MDKNRLSTRAKNCWLNIQRDIGDKPTPEQIANLSNCGPRTYYELLAFLGLQGPRYDDAISKAKEQRRQSIKPLQPPGASVYLTAEEIDAVAEAVPALSGKMSECKTRALQDYERRNRYRQDSLQK